MADMIDVTAPNGKKFHFPKGTAPETINQVLGDYWKTQPDTQELATNLQTGGIEGLAGLAAIPHNVAADLYTNLPPFKSGATLPPGQKRLPPGATFPQANRLPENPIQAYPNTAASLPSQQEAEDFITKNLIDAEMLQGRNPAGRVLQETGKGFTSGLPAGPAGAIGGAVSLGGSQTAEEMGAPQWVQNVVGLAAPLLVGGVSTTFRKLAPGGKRQLSEALRTATADEFMAADKLMQSASKEGNPINWSEALNQVTKGKFGELAQLAQVAEQSPGGASLKEISRNRLEATRAQVGRNLEAVGPLPTGDTLRAVPEKVLKQSSDVVRAAERERTAIASPLYKSAHPDMVPATEMNPIVADLDDAIAHAGDSGIKKLLESLKKDLTVQAGAMSPRVPQTRIQELSGAIKAWKSRTSDAGMPMGDDPYKNKAFTGIAGPILGRIDDVMTRASKNYELAQGEYQKASRGIVDPANRSIAGDIANQAKPDLQAQMEALLPKGKQGINDPAAVSQFIGEIYRRDPEAARGLLRAGLTSEVDDILKEFATAGTSAARSGSLYSAFAGNPKRWANIKASIEALPGGKQTVEGWETMMQTLDATRYRLPGGSDTAPKGQIIRGMEKGLSPVSIEDLNPLTMFAGEVKEAGKLRRYRLNSKAVSDILSDPNSRQKLQALAKLNPNSREARRLTAVILSRITTNTPEESKR